LLADALASEGWDVIEAGNELDAIEVL